jgi:hypothetical protein
MNDDPESTLDRHMALAALVISKLAETCLSARDIDSARSKASSELQQLILPS